jgi:hypothetical protein
MVGIVYHGPWQHFIDKLVRMIVARNLAKAIHAHVIGRQRVYASRSKERQVISEADRGFCQDDCGDLLEDRLVLFVVRPATCRDGNCVHC